MNKIKGSIIAKVTAWLLFLGGAAGIAIFGGIMLAVYTQDYYGMSYEEILEEEFMNVNRRYSYEAYNNIGAGDNPVQMAKKDFRYGIIEAENLEKTDLNVSKSYVESNFFMDASQPQIDEESLLVYRIIQYDNGSSTANMLGYLDDYKRVLKYENTTSSTDASAAEWQGLYADAVCYDEARGIFYYRAEEKYYPIQNVTFFYNGTKYNYSFDFGNGWYKLNYTRPLEELNSTEVYTDPLVTVQETSSEERELNEIEKALTGDGFGSYLTFDILGLLDYPCQMWGELVMDDIRYITGDELTVINSQTIADSSFMNEPGYYLNDDFTLMVQKKVTSTTYWVVSVLPENIEADLHGNLYQQAQWRVNFLYRFGNQQVIGIIGSFISCIILTLVSFIFLASAAGHRKNKEEIVLVAFPDKIPFDIWTAGVLFVEAFDLILITEIVSFELKKFPELFIGALAAGILVFAGIALWYVLSFCTRVKYGKWWHNTLCYIIYRHLFDFLAAIYKNIDILWKLVVIIGAASILEFIAIIQTRFGDTDVLVGWWLLEKAIICVVLVKLVLQLRKLQEGSRHLADGELQYHINTEKMFSECKKHGENLNEIGVGMAKAVEERMKSERMKTELITNVSHDIKTPLTSIINYVDLLEKEELQNERAAEYLEVLDRQSSKLKKLIEDLVEASKASSGSLPVANEELEVGVFLTQTVGEFEEKLAAANLELIVSKMEEAVYIMADGRHLWRVIDNLMNNICKYAQPHSRVYVNLEVEGESVMIAFRNMSKYPLNVNGDELMERFVRGDKSRNTEGHGLGLSIAKSLMDIMEGEMEIYVDGDLFKVILKLKRHKM